MSHCDYGIVKSDHTQAQAQTVSLFGDTGFVPFRMEWDGNSREHVKYVIRGTTFPWAIDAPDS
jgi:hypothetical protein